MHLAPVSARPRRRLWPFVTTGVVAGLVVVAVVTLFAVRRDAAPAPAGLALAEGVRSGGTVIGEARKVADAVASKGLECSVRFTAKNGGHAGCFTFRQQVTTAVAYQYDRDGAVIGLNITNTALSNTAETGPILRSLVDTVGALVFPKDLPRLEQALREYGGWYSGAWGSYEVLSRGPKTSLSARRAEAQALKVPVLHLDSTETALATALQAHGFTCSQDHETCRATGWTVQFSGPDTGITYLVAGTHSQKAFAQLQSRLFKHLKGPAVQPLNHWLTTHRDGRSHIAYVAGWRIDLQVHPTGQSHLTLFNEQVWQVPE
jgi:hypothetical protein